MNAESLFAAWAPDAAHWSPWAKPVLFAAVHAVESADSEAWSATRERARGLWTPPRAGDAALVVDLDGPDALALALECAQHGYRPVPLFNTCIGNFALLDNRPLRTGLELGAQELEAARLPDSAPPAFVLDARRTAGSPRPGAFDNRWLVFPQDLPSATALRARGLQRAVLVQRGRAQPLSDLAHVLLRWQQQGLPLELLDLADTQGAQAAERAPRPLEVVRPSQFRSLSYRLLATLGLRRSSAGGFGAPVPEPPASGGHGHFG